MRLIILSLLVLTVSAFTAGPACPQDREPAAAILGVDAFMRQVERYPGVVQVQGVVSAVSEKDQTLALIDRQEFQECGVTTCATLQLPVRWTGAKPAVREAVLITGQVKEVDGKLLFVARTLETVTQPPKASK